MKKRYNQAEKTTHWRAGLEIQRLDATELLPTS